MVLLDDNVSVFGEDGVYQRLTTDAASVWGLLGAIEKHAEAGASSFREPTRNVQDRLVTLLSVWSLLARARAA